MATQLKARVINVAIKAKVETSEGEDGVKYSEVVPVGRLTLEFDAAGVDVSALSKLIRQQPCYLSFADTQFRLDG